MVFCHKFAEKRCFMIIISYTHDRVTSNQFYYMKDCKSFILFGRFNLEACNVYKALMKGSHNLLVNIKVKKNVGGPSCLISRNNFFRNFSK